MLVTVEPQDRLKWQRLMTSAVERRLQGVEVGQPQVFGQPSRSRCFVSSYSDPETSHEVTVIRDGRGTVTVECDCRAGEVGTACSHAAWAVDTLSLWPVGMVIARQAGLPIHDERYEWHIGDRVDDPEAQAGLGWYFSDELTVARPPARQPTIDPTAAFEVLLTGAIKKGVRKALTNET